MSNESRRKLIKSIALSSGSLVIGKKLPESWSRPIVDSVLLPAHAQTSVMSLFSGAGLSATADSQNNSLFARITDATITDANAGQSASPYLIDACATEEGNNLQVDIQIVDTNASTTHQYSALLPVSGGTVSSVPTDMCSNACAAGAMDISVASISSAFAFVNLTGIGQISIPRAGSCVPSSEPQCQAQASTPDIRISCILNSASRSGGEINYSISLTLTDLNNIKTGDRPLVLVDILDGNDVDLTGSGTTLFTTDNTINGGAVNFLSGAISIPDTTPVPLKVSFWFADTATYGTATCLTTISETDISGPQPD